MQDSTGFVAGPTNAVLNKYNKTISLANLSDQKGAKKKRYVHC